ncbi:MAG: ribosome silencing factor [Chloroflexi bacterium]|nr:ribosome silencing factor [Chloroflexota bacterium]
MTDNQENVQLTTLDYARAIVDIISDVKGEDVVLLDLRDVTVITDFFIICTGNSDRQLKAILEKISMGMKEKYDLRGARIEGNAQGGWVLVDYGDIVVHAFSEEQRDYYDLEGLWNKGKVLLRMK